MLIFPTFVCRYMLTNIILFLQDNNGERLREFYNILAEKVVENIVKNRVKDVSSSKRKENDGPSSGGIETDDPKVNAATIIDECVQATMMKNKGKEKANTSSADTRINEPRVINARKAVVRKINTTLSIHDDDFVEDGLNTKQMSVNVGDEGPVEKEAKNHHMLRSRGSPSYLQKLISSLNDAQKEAVRQIGFGDFLHLQINELTTKLTYWVVKNFDSKELSIQLCNVHHTNLSMQPKNKQLSNLNPYYAVKFCNYATH
ncbi:uncharacterized protein LOC131016113 [Salvia miltiorrhiza]|uniref:uncharacterized protein LOC131016113 n=1 Tax=Salvia miltiorrhiza TaxID=226208 RepID=UPI0025AC573E|nr:uncharacterized protein LOC131016113 [Salvia miltiorrhiza]